MSKCRSSEEIIEGQRKNPALDFDPIHYPLQDVPEEILCVRGCQGRKETVSRGLDACQG